MAGGAIVRDSIQTSATMATTRLMAVVATVFWSLVTARPPAAMPDCSIAALGSASGYLPFVFAWAGAGTGVGVAVAAGAGTSTILQILRPPRRE
jgi:hypothetical protein